MQSLPAGLSKGVLKDDVICRLLCTLAEWALVVFEDVFLDQVSFALNFVLNQQPGEKMHSRWGSVVPNLRVYGTWRSGDSHGSLVDRSCVETTGVCHEGAVVNIFTVILQCNSVDDF